MKAPSTRERWEVVVAAEQAFSIALADMGTDELQLSVSAGLADLRSRRAALRVLASSPASMTAAVLPSLAPLLLVSHSLLAECRRAVLRLAKPELHQFLDSLTDDVVGRSSDYESFRRLAELLRDAQCDELLKRLLNAASQSDDDDVREVVEDFS